MLFIGCGIWPFIRLNRVVGEYLNVRERKQQEVEGKLYN
jgi:hypothetical protein